MSCTMDIYEQPLADAMCMIAGCWLDITHLYCMYIGGNDLPGELFVWKGCI